MVRRRLDTEEGGRSSEEEEEEEESLEEREGQEESESDSDSEEDKDANLKPVSSKLMEEQPKAAKKPRSKPGSATPGTKSATSVKPPAESEDRSNRDSRKAKRKSIDVDGVSEEGTARKQLFQRLWSEDDEIAILKGMIEFSSKKGTRPSADLSVFHDFIKKSLHVDVTKDQLSAKMRRLKKKYLSIEGRSKKDRDRVLYNPHELEAYELSKKIWAAEANGVRIEPIDSPKPYEKERKKQAKTSGFASPKVKEGSKMEAESDMLISQPVLCNTSIGTSSLDDEIMKDGLELLAGPKKVELQEKWKKLRVEELELYLKRVDLIREQTKLVLEALKASGH
ncbi:hypothetical protein NMG60_11009743 [Bertholletia excelsa]